MSIHRLHSTVANITQENDGHADEIQSIQTQLEKTQSRNQQLEIGIQKLHRRNTKLKQTSKTCKQKIDMLEQKVMKQSTLLKNQEFQLMASQLQHHEMQLQLNNALSTKKVVIELIPISVTLSLKVMMLRELRVKYQR